MPWGIPNLPVRLLQRLRSGHTDVAQQGVIQPDKRLTLFVQALCRHQTVQDAAKPDATRRLQAGGAVCAKGRWHLFFLSFDCVMALRDAFQFLIGMRHCATFAK